MSDASFKSVRRSAAPAGTRRSASMDAKASDKATTKRSAVGPSKASFEGKPVISRTAERVYMNGIPASTLVGKYPLVKGQPAPAAPRHFTQDQISAAVTRRMKLA
jgi:hypothetical protein